MPSDRALLLTRLLLLLHLGRGAHGVVEVTFVVSTKQHLLNFRATDLTEEAWKLLARDVRKHIKKIKRNGHISRTVKV